MRRTTVDVDDHAHAAAAVTATTQRQRQNQHQHQHCHHYHHHHQQQHCQQGSRSVCCHTGVSFIFGSIFGQNLENLDFCVVFVNKMMFRVLFFYCFFWVRFFAEVSQIPCFSSLIFRVSFEVFVRKALKNSCFLHGGRFQSEATRNGKHGLTEQLVAFQK